MNIARWFSYTLEIERHRNELRERVRQLEADQKQFIDALARAGHKSPVFDRPVPESASEVSGIAFGPTAVRARRELKEREQEAEIFARAEAARNGSPAIPEVPSQ